ncbi:MAG: aspartyl-phosphate phosphatase Spo0E family protein [Halanaerobiaceae bacterium]
MNITIKKTLADSIEKVRKDLNLMGKDRSFLKRDLIEKSQELDKLINKYNKESYNI